MRHSMSQLALLKEFSSMGKLFLFNNGRGERIDQGEDWIVRVRVATSSVLFLVYIGRPKGI